MRKSSLIPILMLMVSCPLIADKQLDSTLNDYNEKVKRLTKSFQSRKAKYKEDLMKKLEIIKKSKMQKGDLDEALAIDKKIKQLKGQLEDVPESEQIREAAGIGGAPPPPGTQPVNRKDVRKYKKAKSPAEVNKALKALNPGYQMNGRFETEDGRIVQVNLENCYITNIAPLAGLKQVHTIELGDNPLLWDISPIKSLKLIGLSLYNTDVRNLDAVKNCRLEWLNITNTKIKDISPIKRMPLTTLSMGGCLLIQDLSPLEKCKELQELILPVQALDMDIDFLKKFKHLRVIDTRWRDDPRSKEQFWKDKAAR